jgi:hypothetical protein
VSERTPKLKEIAERINAHLKRIEADPELNQYKNATHRQMKLKPYWNSCAWYGHGTRMGIRYISYQGNQTLTKADALEYLAWLDAGNNGKHYEALALGERLKVRTPE